MPIRTCIFDAYGTLFDVQAAARIAAAEPGFEHLSPVWPQLASDWRAKQLEYSWLRAVMEDHTDFWTVTKDALDWALEHAGIQADAALRDRLLQLYRELDTYPEVPDMLRALKERGMSTAILSNGSPEMLADAVTSAGIVPLLDDILSVETVGVFKPASLVYQMVLKSFGTPRDQVLFVSSNGWDIAGAARFGFRTAWVNRMGLPVDRLPGKPDVVLTDLSSIPEIVNHG